MKPFFFNRCFEKSNLKALIAWSLLNFGERKTVNLVEKLKTLGFMYATQAGISLSLDDLKTPPTKIWLISEAEYQTGVTKKEYYEGHLTAVEKSQQLIDTWHRTSELLKEDVIQNFKSTDILNPVYMMAFSGARGNISQVRQLVGMRGLMADPQGQIIDFPIRSNFREGLTLTEYVISCYGARKGLVDTALRTANSGYLTRRLVDVSQHVIIGWMNCGTTRGISLGNMIIDNKIILPLQNRLVGRVLAEDIKPIAFKNQQISLELASKISKLKENILVRSPLTCKHKKFLCQFCYGWSLAYGNLVAMGEAVGVLAAQSIGEPGTQLTMRTFHTGGVFSGGVVDEIRAPFNGFIFFNSSLPGKLIRTSYGKIAFLTKKPGEVVLYSSTFFTSKSPVFKRENFPKNSTQKIKFFLPACAILFIRNAGKIFKGQLVAEFSSLTDQKSQQIRAEHKVYSETAGQIFLPKKNSLSQNKSSISVKAKDQIDSLWILSGKIYKLSVASPLFVKKGDFLDSFTTINQSLGLTTNRGIISSYFSDEKRKTSQVVLSSLYKNKIFKTNSTHLSERSSDLVAKQIVLKQPIQKFFIKNTQYKKFTYFFTLIAPKGGKNLGASKRSLGLQPIDLLFTASSLKENIGQFIKNDQLEWSKKSILYNWFPQIYQTKTSGFLISSKFLAKNYSFEKALFWLSEESYQIFSLRNYDLGKTKTKKSERSSDNRQKRVLLRGWNLKKTPLFYIKNRQLTQKATYLKSSGFFNCMAYLFIRSSIKQTNIHNFRKKNFFLSFTLAVVNQSKKFVFLNKNSLLNKLQKTSERITYKKINLHYESFSVSLGKQKINSINKDQQNSFVTFPYSTCYSFSNKIFIESFFQRLAFFREKNRSKVEIKSKTNNKKDFFENPLVVVKVFLGNQNKKNTSQIKQDPFKQFIKLTSVTKNKKTQIQFINRHKKEIAITFLNFSGKVALKKNFNKKLVNLFPFFEAFRPHIITRQNWIDKKENSQIIFIKDKKLTNKSGWIYFPQNEKKLLKKCNKIQNIHFPKNAVDDLVFDPQIVFTDYLRLEQKNQIFLTEKEPKKLSLESSHSWSTTELKNSKNKKSLFNLRKYQQNFREKKNFNLFYSKRLNQSIEKNDPIFLLKSKLGILSFFLNTNLSEHFFPLKHKNFNSVLLSSRENEDFKVTFIDKKIKFCFAPYLKTLELSRLNNKSLASKRKNPWIKRNLQLIINKNDYSSDIAKIASKAQTLDIFSVIEETAKEKKKNFYYINTKSNVSLTARKKRADIVYLIDKKLKKRPSLKKAQFFDTKKIYESVKLLINSKPNNFSLAKKPYNMFLFGAHTISLSNYPFSYSTLEKVKIKELIPQNTNKNEFGQQKFLKISKPSILVLFRKIKPYSLLNRRQYKKRIYSANKKEIFFESIFSSNFTRQKKTKLFSSEPSQDLQITRVIPLGLHKEEYKFLDKIVLQRLAISVSPLADLGLNALTTQIKSTPVKRKGFFDQTVFLSDYTFAAFCMGNISYKKSSSNLTKETWISTTRPTILTDFLSPYKGEISKSHSNSSCIIITNADQITLSLNDNLVFNVQKNKQYLLNEVQKNNEIFVSGSPDKSSFNKLFAVIGKLIRPGEEITRNTGILQSGQVTKIEAGKITLRLAYPFLLSFGSIFHVKHTSFVEKNDQLFTLFYQIVKTGDIVQGIPKIEQLFEARGPLIEGRGTEERHLFASGLSARFWRVYLNNSQKYSNKIAVRKSFEQIQQTIVQEVYMVYQEQGVNLSEKHLEIIVRQMTSFVLIVNPGGTRFLPGEILPLFLVEKANNYLLFLNATSSVSRAPYYAQYVPVLFGITKAALRSEGFISAASFQETTRVLSQAAIEKRKDYLRGLKENVVLGRVIPAGTGFPMWRWKKPGSPIIIRKENLKGKLQSVKSRFDAESLDSLIL